jgi:hypothetical protein
VSRAPTGCSRDCVFDDAEKCGELWLRAIEIVGREQPQRDDLDTGLIAPAEEVDDLGGARAMTCRRRRTLRLGPAAVAIEDHAYVTWATLRGYLRHETTLVHAIENIGETHARRLPLKGLEPSPHG